MTTQDAQTLAEELRRTQRELAAVRERYFDLYDLAPAGIFTLDAKGFFLEANLTIATILGVEKDSLLKNALSAFIHPDDRILFQRHYERFLDKDAPPSMEIRMLRADGSSFWAGLELTLGYGADDALLCRIVLNDVDEQVRMREDLVRLRTAVDHAHDGIAMADMAGNIQFVNLAWAKMHGYAKEELLGKPLALFHTKEQLEEDVLPFNKKVLSLGSWAGEVGHVHRDGTTFTCWMSTTLLHDENDRVTGFIGMADDITERRRAQQDLARTLKERQAILKAIPDIFYRLDAEMRLQDWNEVFERVTGYTPKELKGRNALDFFKTDRQEAVEGIQETVEKGQAYRKIRLLTCRGEELPYSWSGASLRAEDGRLLGLVGIGRALNAE